MMTLIQDITKIILAFQKILEKTWPEIEIFKEKDKTGAFLMDWEQSCWERIVEQALFQDDKFGLRVYGEGANVNEGSRISFPERVETHQVYCLGKKTKIVDVLNKEKMKSDKENPLLFEQLVTMKGDFYYGEYPFDYSLLKNGEKECVIKTAELLFFLGKENP
jgi:hypothetical protein